jgi:stress response protein SCP2
MSDILAIGGNTAIPTGILTVEACHSGPDTDLSAILVNKDQRVRNDADFVFYGQSTTQDGSVTYNDKKAVGGHYTHLMTIDLSKLAVDVEAIQLTLTIDPDTPATFASVKDFTFAIKDASGKTIALLHPQGSIENAFIVAEIYRRNEAFKIRHVSQGFVGGLEAIATHFGITIKNEEPSGKDALPVANSTKLSLTKTQKVTADLEAKGSRLLSLQKAAVISLTKHRLDNLTARVIMVLDASGSTSHMWPDIMQAVTDRLATLALNLDDNGELEFWIYATNTKKMAVVTIANLDGYIKDLQNGGDGSLPYLTKSKRGMLSWAIVPDMGVDNNEPLVMEAIIKDAKNTKDIPTLVLFVTDGGIDKDHAIEKLLKEASHFPIFWQFIGLGGSSYGVLERFDQLKGRYVDNAGFFAIDDYRSVTDEELYHRVVKEFPSWLTKVKSLGMLSA